MNKLIHKDKKTGECIVIGDNLAATITIEDEYYYLEKQISRTSAFYLTEEVWKTKYKIPAKKPVKKVQIPSFNELSDNDFEGIHFKNEGSYLAVSFERSTGKPAGDGLYPFGELVRLAINRAVIKSLNQEENPVQAMHDFFQRRFKEKVG